MICQNINITIYRLEETYKYCIRSATLLNGIPSFATKRRRVDRGRDVMKQGRREKG